MGENMMRVITAVVVTRYDPNLVRVVIRRTGRRGDRLGVNIDLGLKRGAIRGTDQGAEADREAGAGGEVEAGGWAGLWKTGETRSKKEEGDICIGDCCKLLVNK